MIQFLFRDIKKKKVLAWLFKNHEANKSCHSLTYLKNKLREKVSAFLCIPSRPCETSPLLHCSPQRVSHPHSSPLYQLLLCGFSSHRASPWKSLSCTPSSCFSPSFLSFLHQSKDIITWKQILHPGFPQACFSVLLSEGGGATIQGRNGKLGFLLGTRCAKLWMLTLHILLFFVLRTSQLQAAGNSTGQVTWFLQQLTGE